MQTGNNFEKDTFNYQWGTWNYIKYIFNFKSYVLCDAGENIVFSWSQMGEDN